MVDRPSPDAGCGGSLGTPSARPLRTLSVASARTAGATGRPAAIGALGDAPALIACGSGGGGAAGTRIVPGDGPPSYWDAPSNEGEPS